MTESDKTEQQPGRKRAVWIHQRDDVLTVLEPVQAGDLVYAGQEQVQALEDIPVYHKVARRAVACGQPMYKYGQAMGYATQDILAGQWVHCHNLDSNSPQGGRER